MPVRNEVFGGLAPTRLCWSALQLGVVLDWLGAFLVACSTYQHLQILLGVLITY